MSRGKQYCDGVGEEPCVCHLRPEDGQGEDEEGGGQVDKVKEGQTDHQTERCYIGMMHKDNLLLPMEGVDLTTIAAEDDDKDNVTDNSKHGNNEEKNTLNIKLKVICQGAH